MFTRKSLDKLIQGFLSDLRNAGYSPTKVVLFGSYAFGKPTETSDVDLAVWDARFTGCGAIDIASIASIKSKYPHLEVHFFNSNEDNDPFGEEILKKGKVVA